MASAMSNGNVGGNASGYVLDKGSAYSFKQLCDTATKDTSRPVLTCVHVEVTPQKTYFVACDGFRLAAMAFETSSEAGSEAGSETIGLAKDVPAAMLKKLLSNDSQITVTAEGVGVDDIVLTYVDAGKFPEWRQVLPHASEPSYSLAAFRFDLVEGFFKMRLGSDYKKPSSRHSGLPSMTSLLNYSVHNGSGMLSSHAWCWNDTDIEYLYVLMPLSVTLWGDLSKTEKEIMDQFAEKEVMVKFIELTTARVEGHWNKIKEVTGSIPAMWRA